MPTGYQATPEVESMREKAPLTTSRPRIANKYVDPIKPTHDFGISPSSRMMNPPTPALKIIDPSINATALLGLIDFRPGPLLLYLEEKGLLRAKLVELIEMEFTTYDVLTRARIRLLGWAPDRFLALRDFKKQFPKAEFSSKITYLRWR